jgi:hypothetical protein
MEIIFLHSLVGDFIKFRAIESGIGLGQVILDFGNGSLFLHINQDELVWDHTYLLQS